MGMGCIANFVDVLEDNLIKKICPKEYKEFMSEKLKHDISPAEFEDLSLCNKVKKSDPLYNLCQAYINLCDSFKKKTGLRIELCYHDSDSMGDRYDEVNGEFWAVDGVYQLTPAGRKYKKYIQRKTFVIFG